MSKTHTPGPWRLIPAAAGEPDTEVLACPPGDPEGRLVAAVHDTADTEGEANARLIAAAPALLAACEAAEEVLASVVFADAWRAADRALDAVRAAVALAKQP